MRLVCGAVQNRSVSQSQHETVRADLCLLGKQSRRPRLVQQMGVRGQDEEASVYDPVGTAEGAEGPIIRCPVVEAILDDGQLDRDLRGMVYTTWIRWRMRCGTYVSRAFHTPHVWKNASM
jgi:hypothetical protein